MQTHLPKTELPGVNSELMADLQSRYDLKRREYRFAAQNENPVNCIPEFCLWNKINFFSMWSPSLNHPLG